MDVFQYLIDRDEVWDPTSFGAHNTLSVTEVKHETHTQPHAATHLTIHENDTSQWLAHDNNSTKSLPNVKIVWVEHDRIESQYKIAANTFHEVIHAFELSQAYGYHRTAFAGVAALPFTGGNDHNSRAYSITYHPKLALIWSSQDNPANLTQAVCLASAPHIDRFKALLEANWKAFSDQDMMLAFLCSLLLSTDVDRLQYSIKDAVRGVEVRTGYHQWHNRSEAPPMDDLAVLSAKVSGYNTKTASCLRKIKVIEELNNFILEQIREEKQTQKETKIQEEKQSLDSVILSMSSSPSSHSTGASYCSISQCSLANNIKVLQQRAKMQRVDIEYFQVRIEAQLRALLDVIAQNDTLVNHEIVKASKIISVATQRDSSSQKALAGIAMLFLPGTFVAAVFAIPFRKWNPSSSIYWAIVVPLTIVVVAICSLWTFIQRNRNVIKNQDAEAQIDSKLSTTEVRALVDKRHRIG